MMDETNPYASPVHAGEAGLDRMTLSPTLGVWGIVVTSLSIYLRYFPAILFTVLVVRTPVELFTSYMNYFVFTLDDVQLSKQLVLLLEVLVGIVATGVLISIADAAVTGERVRLSAVFFRGLAAWPRLFGTRLLCWVGIALGLLACFFPGIILAIRLALAETVAVVERLHGPTAIRRSFELTRDRIGTILLLIVLIVGSIYVVSYVIFLPLDYFPAMNHWLIDAGLTLVLSMIAALMPVCFYVAYRAFVSPAETQGEAEE